MCQLLFEYLGDKYFKDVSTRLFLSMNNWCKVMLVIAINLIYCQIIKNVDFVQKYDGSAR